MKNTKDRRGKDLFIEELFAGARAGDERARDELFKTLREIFEYISRLRGVRESDIEDVVHGTVVELLKSFDTVAIRKTFGAYARAVLGNVIKDYFNQRRQLPAEREPAESGNSPSNDAEFTELTEKLLKCMRRLIRVNRKYARILNLRYQGFRIGEISRRLGITVNNCSVILKRARNKLEKCLDTGRI